MRSNLLFRLRLVPPLAEAIVLVWRLNECVWVIETGRTSESEIKIRPSSSNSYFNFADHNYKKLRSENHFARLLWTRKRHTHKMLSHRKFSFLLAHALSEADGVKSSSVPRKVGEAMTITFILMCCRTTMLDGERLKQNTQMSRTCAHVNCSRSRGEGFRDVYASIQHYQHTQRESAEDKERKLKEEMRIVEAGERIWKKAYLWFVNHHGRDSIMIILHHH